MATISESTAVNLRFLSGGWAALKIDDLNSAAEFNKKVLDVARARFSLSPENGVSCWYMGELITEEGFNSFKELTSKTNVLVIFTKSLAGETKKGEEPVKSGGSKG